MTTKTGRWVILGLALVMALPGPAMASHFSQYLFTPTTHDDVGRSDEPSFRGATNILGPAVGDRNIDTNLDGLGESYQPGLSGPGLAKVVAPGCTDDAGRQPSGLCGLWTVGAGVGQAGLNVVPPHTVVAGVPVGVQGMSHGKAPGRFTPTTSTSVRILDTTAQNDASVPAAPVTIFNLNHAVGDLPVAGTLGAAGVSTPFVFGPTNFLTWYGTWTDKNGNGVIDFEGKACSQTNGCGTDGGVTASNEFVWDGNCIGISGLPAPANQQYCNAANPSVAMPMWVYPGDHHASCFSAVLGADCATIGMDYPGHQALCFVDAVGAIATGIGGLTVVGVCTDDLTQFDEFDQNVGGDPLLGPQNSVRVDDLFSDRTGDPSVAQRNWVWGSGFPTTFYDGSILVTTTTVTIVTTQTQADTGTSNYYDLTQSKMTDVDQYTSWSPLVGNLLQNSVKPTVRGEFVFVRDGLVPVQKASDALTNNRLQYDQCDTSYLRVGCLTPVGLGPTEGSVDDTVFNNGVAQEPNTPADVEPGASFHSVAGCASNGDNAFKGWCNSYAGYAAGWHNWVDTQDFPATYFLMGWSNPVTGSCIVCEWTGPTGVPNLPTGPHAAGNHDQSLQPGTHVFSGVVGAWNDRAQRHDKEKTLNVANLPALTFTPYDYTVGPDGWVGDIVNNTGFIRSRGYGPETCTIGSVTAQYEYAQCHPYADGNRDRPADSYNTDASTGGEFQFATSVSGGNTVAGQLAVSISPNRANPGSNDCWNVPILVWRQIDHWTVGALEDIQNYQGKCGADAVITMPLGLNGGGTSDDQLLLPEGNLGQTVVAVTSAMAHSEPPTVNGLPQPAVDEFVQDVDVYVPYSA